MIEYFLTQFQPFSRAKTAMWTEAANGPPDAASRRAMPCDAIILVALDSFELSASSSGRTDDLSHQSATTVLSGRKPDPCSLVPDRSRSRLLPFLWLDKNIVSPSHMCALNVCVCVCSEAVVLRLRQRRSRPNPSGTTLSGGPHARGRNPEHQQRHGQVLMVRKRVDDEIPKSQGRRVLSFSLPRHLPSAPSSRRSSTVWPSRSLFRSFAASTQ